MEKINKLKKIIETKKWNQDFVARELGVTFATLNRWLNNKAQPRRSANKKIDKLISNYQPEFSENNYIELLANFSIFDEMTYSEKELKYISELLKKKENIHEKLFDLISLIPEYGKNFDWNIGSLIKHFDPEIIIDILKKIENLPKFYNSIGLCWVLGELNRRDVFVLNFLHNVLRFSTSSEAIWRAAFSIENLDQDEDAIVLLKRNVKIDHTKEIGFYVKNIIDKKSIIAILLKSNVENTQTIIYPLIKNAFIKSRNIQEQINISWLIGRLNLIDNEILLKIKKNIITNNYELKYYTYFALQHNTIETMRSFYEKGLCDNDPLIRKMSARSLRKLGGESSLGNLESALDDELDSSVVQELSKAIYSIKNPKYKSEILLQKESIRNENGMIYDETDKWYKDAFIYNIFSESEDPQNVCIDLVLRNLKNHNFINPIDLATGTGRYLFQMRKKIKYTGTLFGVDYSEDMCAFVEKRIRREKSYVSDIKIIQSSIEDISKKIKVKSSFIISSFGFPSRISNKEKVYREIKSVYEQLTDDGYFVTVGWDETFNDDLNYMWFKYIPDNIFARNFEEWRRKKVNGIQDGARNCNLSWFKKGLNIPLHFASVQESVSVMGYLFGRESVKSIIKKNRIDWKMSMGITINTKKSLKEIINKYERNRNII